MNSQASAAYREGQLLQAARRFDEALVCYERALAGADASPEIASLLNEHGALLSDMGRFDEAVESYDRAVAIAPDNLAAFYNRGNALRELGRPAEAVTSYDRALALDPRLLPAWNNRGTLLHAMARHDEAVESFDRMLAIHPGIAEAWNNRGIALAALQRHDEALHSYDKAIHLDDNFAKAWDNRANLLAAMGRPDEALASSEKSLARNPAVAESWYNRGNLLREQRDLDGALQCYDRALALNPDNAQAWSNRGIVLRDMKRIAEALASYGKALAIEPHNARTLTMRGILSWVEAQDYDAAVADLERAVHLDADCPYALGNLLLVRQYGGDWRDFDNQVALIDAAVRAGKPVAEPFVYQAISQSPADLQACSEVYARDRFPAAAAQPFQTRAAGKIRIGYVSGEFREQATAYLMAGVYECHDRSRFEIIAFDNCGSDSSPMRARLEAAFDKWVDITRISDRDAADAVRAAGIDVLVNLNGYFGEQRTSLFALRPAPVQVNYLGFPATLGADYMDYIIADRIVIPQSERRFYTEQVAYLPHCYQANDKARAVARNIPARAECGLPAGAFVFCNFNTGYKLTPATFATWMRILRQVPGSVLWLLAGGCDFERNLKQAAEAQGVAGGRLIFAPVMAPAPHLARLTLAQLFLDGLPCNAHTTASDALWAGVPLLTLRGTAFAGRVAASLLTAIGLPELVTESRESYENLAVALAQDTTRLQSLRQKLAHNRLTTPLFDTAAFTRHIETVYEGMMARLPLI